MITLLMYGFIILLGIIVAFYIFFFPRYITGLTIRIKNKTELFKPRKQIDLVDDSMYMEHSIFSNIDYLKSNSYGFMKNIWLEKTATVPDEFSAVPYFNSILFMKHCIFIIDTINFNGDMYYNPEEEKFYSYNKDFSFYHIRDNIHKPLVYTKYAINKIIHKTKAMYNIPYEKFDQMEDGKLSPIVHIIIVGGAVHMEDNIQDFLDDKYRIKPCYTVRSGEEALALIDEINTDYKNHGIDVDIEDVAYFFSKMENQKTEDYVDFNVNSIGNDIFIRQQQIRMEKKK